MFDIGASEFLLIVVVAVVVIGPKDLPVALRTAGRWIAKIRRVSGHFRSGLETMIREAELEEMERKWKEQNEAIMKAHPQLGDNRLGADAPVPGSAESAVPPSDPVNAPDATSEPERAVAGPPPPP